MNPYINAMNILENYDEEKSGYHESYRYNFWKAVMWEIGRTNPSVLTRAYMKVKHDAEGK